jgi:hypothetical protein
VTIEVRLEYDSIRVLFDGVMHTHVRRAKLLGIYAWTHGPNNFGIDYVMAGGSMTCEYDERGKWLEILAGLADVL